MIDMCPGAAGFKGPQKLTVKTCPDCGREIEIFTRDIQVKCQCGFTAFNEIQSCIKWCAYVKECVGDLNEVNVDFHK